MAPRSELHLLLKAVAGVDNVYFQPPPTTRMEYPCIVYKRDDIDATFANNLPYNKAVRYQVTIIDPDPDSDIPRRISELPKCSYDRFYTANNLNHDIYNLFF